MLTNACIKIPLFGALSLLLLLGCSTRKNTFAARTYHQFVTRYNSHFNAQQLYDETLRNQSSRFQDDYSALLPIHPFVRVTDKNQRGGAFDGVVEKTERTIRHHSISSNGDEEHNPFLHHVWLLLGKAHVQNQDYDDALAVFLHTEQLFRNNKNVVVEALLWKMRIYTETSQWVKAVSLQSVLRSMDLPQSLVPLMTETTANLLLQKGEYANAIPYLQETIAFQRNDIQRRRLQFLLGQTLVEVGDNEAAFLAFESVKGLRTPFELSLNTIIRQSQIATDEQLPHVMAQLQRMSANANSTYYLERNSIFFFENNDESTFYFFNRQLVEQGKMDFRRQWGDRAPEDNWRTINRTRTLPTDL